MSRLTLTLFGSSKIKCEGASFLNLSGKIPFKGLSAVPFAVGCPHSFVFSQPLSYEPGLWCRLKRSNRRRIFGEDLRSGVNSSIYSFGGFARTLHFTPRRKREAGRKEEANVAELRRQRRKERQRRRQDFELTDILANRRALHVTTQSRTNQSSLLTLLLGIQKHPLPRKRKRSLLF